MLEAVVGAIIAGVFSLLGVLLAHRLRERQAGSETHQSRTQTEPTGFARGTEKIRSPQDLPSFTSVAQVDAFIARLTDDELDQLPQSVRDALSVAYNSFDAHALV